MRCWRDLVEVPRDIGRSVMTIGVFDGVHRGHQYIIRRAVAAAAERGDTAVVVTFDPHPAEVVRPDAAPPLLATVDRRLELFAELGVDAVLVLPFTAERSQQRAEDFVRELAGALNPTSVVVGADFRYGFKAAGDVALLERLGGELGFDVDSVRREGPPNAVPHSGEPGSAGSESRDWSSTAVRERLRAGDVAGAAELLGHPFRLDGVVVEGARRGRELGIPTANVPVDPRYAVPADGVYAGWLVRHDDPTPDDRLPAVISVGTNPQFGAEPRRVEAHVLDRGDLELYGVSVGVEFVAWVRGQQTFDSVEGLIEQEHRDIARAHTLL